MPARLPALTPLLLLLLVLPLLPTDLWSSVATYNAARAGQGVVLLAAVLLALWKPVLSAQTIWPWVLLLVLATSSCLLAAMPGAAARDGLWTVAWLLALPVLAEALKDQSVRDRTLAVIVAGQFAYVLLASAMLMHGMLVEQLVSPWHMFPGYENPRYFNHTQTLSLPLLAAYSLWPQAARHWRRLAAAAVVLHVFLICIFLARATVVSVLVATLVVSACLRETRLLKALLLYAALGALLYVIGLKLLPHWLGIAEVPAFRDPGDRGSVEARLYLWQIALQAIREHPWLGVGPMHFAHTPNGEAAHPHNIYLQVAAEYGLPFAVLAISLLARWLYRLFIQLRGTNNVGIAMGCFIAILGALIDGMFSGNLVMPLSQSWLALCIGLLIALQQARNSSTPPRPSSTWRQWPLRGLHACVAGGLLIVLMAMAHELAQPEVNLSQGVSLTPGTSNPRFWLDGWF